MRKSLVLFCLQMVIMLIAGTGCCTDLKVKKSRNVGGDQGVKRTELAKKLPKRVALVIGNNRYATATLKTPINDAHALAATLRRLGFVVEEKNNLGRAALKAAVTEFVTRMKDSEVGLLYFSGHGVQVQGENYLLPVDAKISSERDLRNRALAVNSVLDKMQAAKSAVKIVVLDASRENPVGRSFRLASSGLASMDPPPGTIVATSTTAGLTTLDSGNDSIGGYAQALIQALDTPGLKVSDILHQVRTQIAGKTAKTQIPWEYSLLVEDISFVPPFVPSDPRLQSVSDGDCSERTGGCLPHLRGFTDQLTGMEFMPVPGGCFQMGDTFGNGLHWEKPVHVACVADFAIGKYEVTQGQWRQVMGENPSHFNTCGDDCPVENVSWTDVQGFIRKMNQVADGKYRLPTEAEWEYAARSGGKSEMFSGGSELDTVAWYDLNAEGMTRRVGTKQANGLGVYDLSGNVWEWVQDWYGSYNNGRQENPPGPLSGSFRVFRGGSWSHSNAHSRVSTRYYNAPDARINFLGFRLATAAVR